MKSRPRIVVGLLVTAGFCVWAAYVLFDRWSDLPHVSPRVVPLGVSVVLIWLVIAINSTMVEYTARQVGRGLGQLAAQKLGVVTTLFNYFLPMRAGLILRLVQYVRVAGHDPVRLVAALFTSTLVVQLVGVTSLLACVWVVRDVSQSLMLAGVVALVPVAAIVWWAGRSGAIRDNAIGRAVERTRQGSKALLRNGPRPFAVLALLSFLAVMATGARYQAVIAMLDVEASLWVAVALAAGAGLSGLISVTFGGFGVREAAVVIVGSYCGLPAETSLIIALLDRVIVSAAVAVVGIPLLVRERSLWAWR